MTYTAGKLVAAFNNFEREIAAIENAEGLSTPEIKEHVSTTEVSSVAWATQEIVSRLWRLVEVARLKEIRRGEG